MPVPAEKLYNAVKNGQLKIGDLNTEHKQILHDYVAGKLSTRPAEPTATKPKAGGFWGGYDTPMEWFDTTPLGKFQSLASQTAVQGMAGDRTPINITTGNPIADKVAKLIGIGGSFVLPGGGIGAVTPAGGSMQLGTKGVEAVLPKVAPGIANAVGGKSQWLRHGLEAAGGLGTYALTESQLNQDTPLQTAKNVVLNAGLGLGLGVGGSAVAEGAGKVISKLAKPKTPLEAAKTGRMEEYLQPEVPKSETVPTGPATWRNQGVDQPVNITGDLGVGADGRWYVSIAESNTGIPVDELVTVKTPTVKAPEPATLTPEPLKPVADTNVLPAQETGVKEPWQMTKEEFLQNRPAVDGYSYHGSPEGDLSNADPYAHTQNWREGIGFYTTESRDMAEQYAKGRTAKSERKELKGAINYIKGQPNNILDMDATVDKQLWKDVVNKVTGSNNDTYLEDWLKGTKTNREAYREVIDYLKEEGLGSEAQYAVEEHLQSRGIQATTHTEGIKKGTPHKVTIYKQGDINIVPPDKVHKELVQQALSEGKSVPPEVLRDYPDLVLKPETPKIGEVNKRGFVETLQESPKTSEEVASTLETNPKSYYEVKPNVTSAEQANANIAQGLDETYRKVMTVNNKNDYAEVVFSGHRLIDEYGKLGGEENIKKAVDVAEKMAELGTKWGQGIQAFSGYNRLTPEGVLVHAQRIAKKVNENLPIGAKPAEVTSQMADQLMDLATTGQQMGTTKGLANDVLTIIERAKTGEKLTAEETAKIKQLISEARKFVKSPGIKEAKPIQNVRVRDTVIEFFDKQEMEAMARIKARRSRLNTTPIDEYADWAIVGASKLAKGTVKFAKWSEDMVKTLGEEIRPHLEDIYSKATELFNSKKSLKPRELSNVEKIAEKVIKSKNVGEAEAKEIRTMASKVANLSGDAKDVASQDLQFVLNQLERPTVGQRISMGQTIMQLFNPKTWTRNIIGNEVFYRLERLNKYVSTPIDWATSKLTGKERTITFAKAGQGGYWEGFLKGAKAGLKGVNPEGLTTQFDIKGTMFKSKLNPLHWLEKGLGLALKGFDYAAYLRAKNQTIGELATLRAMNEGLKGEARNLAINQYVREADENIIAVAEEYGKYVTYQDNNVLSMALTKVKRALNLGQDFGFGDMVLKYPKTPGALIMRGIEYSPAGFLRSAYQLKPLLQGKPANSREAILALSRAITGTTGLTGMGYFLADKGIITGAASKDKDLRELQRQAGEGAYQVNGSALTRWVKSGFNPAEAETREGDTLFSYDWMQPIAMAISLGANIQQNVKEQKEPLSNVGQTVVSSIEGGLSTMVEQPVLQGILKLTQGYSDGEGLMKNITNIAKEVPASFTPTLLNQLRAANDNTKRVTYNPSPIMESLAKAQAKVPGYAANLPIDYDTLGRPKLTYQDNSWFNVFLNPAFVNKYELTPSAKLVIDIYKQTGETKQVPRVVNKYLIVDKHDIDPTIRRGQTVKIDLTPEEFSELQRITGTLVNDKLSRMSPRRNADEQIEAIVNVLNDAGEKGRNYIKRQKGIRVKRSHEKGK